MEQLSTKKLMGDCASKLKEDKILKPEQIVEIIDKKYPEIWNSYDVKNRYTE